MQSVTRNSDNCGMASKPLTSNKRLIAAMLILGLLAAILLDRVFDNAQWWWLWAWTSSGKP